MKTSGTALVRVLSVVCFILSSCPVMAQLKAAFTASPQSGCAPLIVSYQNTSSGQPDSWKWDLGGGVTSTEENPTTSYFDPGVYAVKLIVYKAGTSDSVVKTNYITVFKNPQAAFSVSDSTGCFPLNVNYIDKSTAGSGAITKWVWDFGDGNISTGATPTHTYTTAGIYSITLSVTNAYGCSNTVSSKDLIHTSHGVSADFSARAVNVCKSPAGYDFAFTGKGDGTLTYEWQFGDGKTATGAQASHDYINEGPVTVSLRVTSSTGCSDINRQPLSIAFVKSIINAPDTVCLSNKVQFINASTPAPASAVWSFGDNTTSTSTNATKAYNNIGEYTVKLVNTFAAGCVDSTTTKIKVVNAATAAFVTNDSSSCTIPYTAHFTNNSVNAQSYVWDFGDGTTSTEVNPVHVYTKYGSFDVVLKALNAGGCVTSAVIEKAVNIQPFKITGVTGLVSGCVPFSVTPKVTTNLKVPIAKYSWNFGDGFTSNDASPAHTFTKEGIYSVKVVVQTAGGCTDSLTIVDSVGRRLGAAFTVSPTNVCAGQEVTFNNITPQPADFLWWFPGDGDVIFNQANPAHNYTDTGVFSPMLVVLQNGCLDTVIKKNAVHIAAPIAKFNVKNSCDNRMQVSFTNKSIEDKTRRWEFGDGANDTTGNPVHIYNAPGTYVVKLSVSNGTCNYTTTQQVKVVNEKGILKVDNSIACRHSKLNYTILNVNMKNIDKVIWRLYGGMNSSAPQDHFPVVYDDLGDYNPNVVMTDILGCSDTLLLSEKLIIYGPDAKFKTLTPGACKNGNIQFSESSTTDGQHPITTWAVDFGDGQTGTYSTGGLFDHPYKDTGAYTVKLTVTDTYGCSDATQQVGMVHITQPYASFQLSDTLVCPGKLVAFNNNTVGVGLSYTWNFGDGIQGGVTNPNHLYTVQGDYSPSLNVTDINGCKDSITIKNAVHVFTPTAKFLMSDSFSTCPPLAVTFTDQSSNLSSYQWSFGDGNTSNLTSPVHLYTYPGIYSAKLVVKGNGACKDSITKTITIKGPTGELLYDASAVCAPASRHFKVAAQNATQYLWDYSDGNTQLTTNTAVNHVYAPGFYVPKIILIDKDGCKVPVKGNDTLKIYGIKAKAFVSNNLLCDSGNVVFKDSSVTNDVITSSNWIFEGSATAAGASVSHYYNASGTYHVKLVDITANGCTDSVVIATPIRIAQSPVVKIKGQTSFCLPATVAMQGINEKADTSAVTWNWDFGNGVTSTTQNPAGIAFNAAGDYQVSLSATNSSGCTDTFTTTVSIHALPMVSAGADTTICKFSSVILHPTGAASYIWNAAPGLACNCPSPEAKPDSTQTYIVTGTDAFGCSATDSVVVSVSQPVHVTVSKNDTLCNGQTKQLAASGAATYQWYPALYLSDASVAQPTFTAVRDTSITYRVIGVDAKKCFNDTGFVKVKVYPIPQLQVTESKMSASAGTSVTLSTINSPDITKWKWSPPLWLDNPNAANPVAQPRESITYTVVAANEGSCVTRQQVAVTVICSGANIFVPNTFSPNGDGVNDVFYARGTGLYNIKSIRVFNRWGQLVFERLNAGANNSSDGWDGTFNGQKAPADVYIYVVEVLCVSNTIIPVKGNITLVR